MIASRGAWADLAWAGCVALLYGSIAWQIAAAMPEGWAWFAHQNQLVDGANFWSIAGGYLGQPLWHPSSATALWQQRLLYPALAALLTLGDPGRLPFTLVVVNILAAGALTWALAATMRRAKLPAWPALGPALSAGGLVVLLSDVADLVLAATIAAGWALWPRRRVGAATALLALAVLAKEPAWLFVLPIAGAEIRRGRWRAAAAISGGAAAAFTLAFAVNQWRFGGLVPFAAVQQTVTWPFAGLWPLNPAMPVAWAAYAWIVYVLPALAIAAWAITRRPIDAAGGALLANTLLLVCLAPASWSSPIHFTRLALPVWLAAAFWLAGRRSRAGVIGLASLGPISLLGYGLILASGVA